MRDKVWYEQAKNRLEREAKKVTGSRETAMRNAVKNALLDFCQQDEEFAQAVVQGGTFADCMKVVASGVGSSISDLEAYRKAVTFYFPGADIHMMLRIDLCSSVEDNETPDGSGCIHLDLGDYL